jgi:hypothetical protein
MPFCAKRPCAVVDSQTNTAVALACRVIVPSSPTEAVTVAGGNKNCPGALRGSRFLDSTAPVLICGCLWSPLVRVCRDRVWV